MPEQNLDMPEQNPDRDEQTRPKRRHRRAVRPGTGPEPIIDRSQFENGKSSADSDDDERFLRDVPPHWS